MESPVPQYSSLSIPYRYDLSTGGDFGISYFVDNGLTQGFFGTQDGSPADHESFCVCNFLGCTSSTSAIYARPANSRVSV